MRKGFVLYLFIGLVSQKINWYVVERLKGSIPNDFIHFPTLRLLRSHFYCLATMRCLLIVLGLFYKLNMVVMSWSIGEGRGREKV